MGWLWNSKPTQHQQDRLDRKCGYQARGLKGCQDANPNNEQACEHLKRQVDLCRSSILCPQQAQDFTECINESMANGKTRLDRCEKEYKAVQKCLRGIDFK
mmetsp:Transcript_23896/g.28911  ORF Transcript_23896/g.28911 Transcript_23896/m.28911 type:complete len:101 (-) Transcript_23896:1603-1905(-)